MMDFMVIMACYGILNCIAWFSAWILEKFDNDNNDI